MPTLPTGEQLVYRVLLVLVVTFILSSGAEVKLTGYETAGILFIAAIPFIGFLLLRPFPLWARILVALFAGLLVGVVINKMDVSYLAKAVQPVGAIFLKLISMLIVPLIFSTLTVGTASIENLHTLGRIGRKTIGLYFITTTIAVTIGLTLGTIFQPGAGAELEEEISRTMSDFPELLTTVLESIPENPIQAMAEGKILQIIVFAIFSGICIFLVGFRAKPILNFLEAVAEMMFTMTGLVMEYAPYGVFALIVSVAGQYGTEILRPLATVILLVYGGCLFHAILVYGTLVKVLGKMSPIRFFKSLTNAVMVAFTTSSSTATLPVTMRCVQENLGVSKNVSSVVLPLGSTVNMDGTALYLGICTLFIAQFYSISLTLGDYFTIAITAILVSIGAAGIPGAAAMMLVMVLRQVNLPPEGIALIIGIDRILDMIRSSVNVTGDACVSLVVAESEHEVTLPSKVLV